MSPATELRRRLCPSPAGGRGFTLIEVLAVCAISILLAGLAWPSYRGQWLRAGRSEAMQALVQLQAAQERHREMFGRYAADLSTVGLKQATERGRYELALTPTGAESYRAEAIVRTGGAQVRPGFRLH